MSEHFEHKNSGKHNNSTNNKQNDGFKSTSDMSVHIASDGTAVTTSKKSSKKSKKEKGIYGGDVRGMSEMERQKLQDTGTD